MATEPPNVDPATPPVTDPPAGDPNPNPSDPTSGDPPPAVDPKEENRTAYELRKAREEADKLRKENEAYKRREEEARKAKLTDDERLKEERDELESKLRTLEAEVLAEKRSALCLRIATEEKLPADLTELLKGESEADIRDHAQRLAKLVAPPKAPDQELGNRGGDPSKNGFTEQDRQRNARSYSQNF